MVNTTQSQEMPHKAMFISFYVAIMILAFIGNVLIIVVVMFNRNLRTEFNYLIVNMAVSDLLVSIFVLPLAIAEKYLNHHWITSGLTGIALCKVLPFLSDITSPVSIFSLVGISINRFLASVYPVWQKTLAINLNKILIVITWIVPVGFFLPYFYTHTININQECGPFKFNQSQLGIYMRLSTVLFFLIPLLIIITLYTTIVIKLQQSSAVLSQMLNEKQLQKRKQKNKQIFYLSIAIISAFLILWGPFQVMLLLLSFNLSTGNHFMPYRWTVQLLAFATAVVNPAICFMFITNYRIGLRNIILRIRGKYNENSSVLRVTSCGERREFDSKMTTAL